MKKAFLFPGQGSQILEMAKDFYDTYPDCKRVFEESSDSAGIDVADICFHDENRLNITEYTQVALMTAEACILRAVTDAGVSCDITAGQSLGEYTALIASGRITLGEAAAIVRKRGIWMQRAVPEGEGAMGVIVGMTHDAVNELCAQTEGKAEISNYNSEKQTVVAGERLAVEKVIDLATQAHARLATLLNVSVPSHCYLMKPAAEKLEKLLASCTFTPSNIPYVANATGSIVTDSKQTAQLLVQQLYSPVKWEQSIAAMKEYGVDRYIEIGPGEILTKMNKKIDKTLDSINIATVEDLEKLSC